MKKLPLIPGVLIGTLIVAAMLWAADITIPALVELAGGSVDPANDLLIIEDVSAGASGTKKIKVNSLMTGAAVSQLGTSIDLSGAEATGTLAAARFPALSGAITTTAGSLVTTLAADSVTSAKIGTGEVGTTDLADGAVTIAKISATGTPGSGNFLRGDGAWEVAGAGGFGVAGHAQFAFNATTTEPPVGSQIRVNNATQTAATRMWIAQTTTDGLDVTTGLERILAGHQIYLQDRDDASKWVKYSVSAPGTDDGAYFDFTVVYHSGPGNVPAGQAEIQSIAPGATGIPTGGTTGQVLAKNSATDYDVEWITGGGGAFDLDALTAATEADLTTDTVDMWPVSDGGTEKKITTENLRDKLQSMAWTFSTLDAPTLNATNLVLPDGSAAAPPIYFGGATTNGFYGVTPSQVGVAISGASKQVWSPTQSVLTVPLTSTVATGTAPFTVASTTPVANLTATNLSGGTVDATTGSFTGAITFPDNVRQIFNPGTTVAGLNVGSQTTEPSTPVNGDIWYNQTSEVFRVKGTGATDSMVTAAAIQTLTNKDLTDGTNVLPAEWAVAVSDETTALTAGTAKVTFRMPYAMTVTAVRASVTTAATGGTLLTVDINEAGTTILSTKLTFDASEKTTTTAATAAVISDAALADDAEITVDVDAIGSTIAGAGLKILLKGNR